MTTNPGGTSTVETLTRSIPFQLDRSSMEGDGLTLSGYAAVFNSVTRIDSWEGLFDEQIAPGAFAKTIRESTPVMQFDHGKHPLLGSLPIGRITALKEDARGLHVEARLHDNWLTQPVRDAIASGSVDGMSFRFSVPKGKETWDRTGEVPLRTIKELRVAELGPVVFPAYESTTVSVRSLAGALAPLAEDMAEDTRAALVGAVADTGATMTMADVIDRLDPLMAGLDEATRSEVANAVGSSIGPEEPAEPEPVPEPEPEAAAWTLHLTPRAATLTTTTTNTTAGSIWSPNLVTYAPTKVASPADRAAALVADLAGLDEAARLEALDILSASLTDLGVQRDATESVTPDSAAPQGTEDQEPASNTPEPLPDGTQSDNSRQMAMLHLLRLKRT